MASNTFYTIVLVGILVIGVLTGYGWLVGTTYYKVGECLQIVNKTTIEKYDLHTLEKARVFCREVVKEGWREEQENGKN